MPTGTIVWAGRKLSGCELCIRPSQPVVHRRVPAAGPGCSRRRAGEATAPSSRSAAAWSAVVVATGTRSSAARRSDLPWPVVGTGWSRWSTASMRASRSPVLATTGPSCSCSARGPGAQAGVGRGVEDHRHRCRGRDGLHLPGQLVAVHVGHHHVTDHHRRLQGREHAQRECRGAGLDAVIAAVLQHGVQQVPAGVVVVDHQHRHTSPTTRHKHELNKRVTGWTGAQVPRKRGHRKPSHARLGGIGTGDTIPTGWTRSRK